MVKRTPPLTLAVIGTGETSAKNVEALLNDYTSTYAEVTFVLPVDDNHWTDTLTSVHEWVVANDIPYVAVTDGTPAPKSLNGILDKADSTIKVARVSTKMVQLLQQEASEGDVALLVAWDDDDQEAVLAVNKALAADVQALNLLDGLDPFEFDEEDGESGDEVRQEPKLPPLKGNTPPQRGDDDEDDEEPAAKATDIYDSKGIRALRALLRERSAEHDIPDRTIGQLEKEDAIRALRNIDAGKGKAATKVETDVKPRRGRAEEDDLDPNDTPLALDTSLDEPDEAQAETRTTRARRAFAEGAGQSELPKSRGGDILDTEGGVEDTIVGTEIIDKGFTTLAPQEDHWTRQRALELAVQAGAGPDGVIPLAMKMETYLRGERASAGRPRADGTPAQPRDIDPDTGKPVRRRRSTE